MFRFLLFGLLYGSFAKEVLANSLFETNRFSIERPDTLKYTHSINLEALGPGILGSIGYDMRFFCYEKTKADIAIGIGGTYLFKVTNPWTAMTLPLGLNLNYSVTSRLDFSMGLYWVNYFNYWGMIKGTKDCAGALQCPPDHDNFWAPRIGVSYHFSRFAIEMNCYKYFNFWAYDWFIPSLKIKYHVK